MKRALISVHDKTGVIEFAKALQKVGFTIVSTGGTLKTLEEGGVRGVVQVSEVTGLPEILDGRIKTLHPKLMAGILAMRNKKQHIRELQKLEVLPVDLVACNLYPFKKVTEQGADLKTAQEYIDIGGPNMIRAAAKNFQNVVVVVDPERYHQIVDEYKQHGNVSYETRKTLAVEAFKTTSEYDKTIHRFLETH
jgi:phosphoribosylaminoimidazolecarboxamide formyltransferase/IMP cyclohydrolase